MSLLGIDIGTSGVRAAAFADDGRLLAVRAERTYLERSADGRVIIDMTALAAAAERLLAAVASLAASSGDAVTAIGLSSAGEAIVPVDRSGLPTDGAVVGLDSRGGPAAAEINKELGAARVHAVTGQPLHPMYSIYKIAAGDGRWRPPQAAGYRGLADFLLGRWGMPPVMNWASAARTGAFDIEAGTWSTEIITVAAQSAPWAELLARSATIPCGTPVGSLGDATATRLGVPAGTTVVAGAHDQASSYLGSGGRAGKFSTFSFGSSDCMAVGTDTRPSGITGSGLATYPITSSHWLTIAGTAAGGWALEWYAGLTGAATEDEARELLDHPAEQPPALLVLPYLAGANTLDNDSHARGSIAGLTLDTTKPQLTRAFLEAAGYELRYLVDAFEHTGIPVGSVRVVGGGVANRSALQIRASAADLRLEPVTAPTSARGAAFLAGVGTGIFRLGHLPEPEVAPPCAPEPAHRAWYAGQRRAYRQLYEATRPINEWLFRAGSANAAGHGR